MKEPLLDSRFRTWSAGDTYIIYPDGRSSIRFEQLREGVQDAEKIAILRVQLQAENSTESTEQLGHLNQKVAEFNLVQNPGNTEEMLHSGKQSLYELSKR